MWVSRGLGVLCLLAGALTFAQTAGAPGTNQTSFQGTLPLRALYRHFLALQNHLDRAAAVRDKQGTNGSGLRNHYQRELGFTDAEFTAVRQAGLRLEAELREQDAKAKAVIDAAHAQHAATVGSVEYLPPIPPELVELQKGRDSLIDQEVGRLKAELGREAAAALDRYLQYHFASNVTVRTVPPPPPHKRAQNPVPASAKGVQQ